MKNEAMWNWSVPEAKSSTNQILCHWSLLWMCWLTSLMNKCHFPPQYFFTRFDSRKDKVERRRVEKKAHVNNFLHFVSFPSPALYRRKISDSPYWLQSHVALILKFKVNWNFFKVLDKALRLLISMDEEILKKKKIISRQMDVWRLLLNLKFIFYIWKKKKSCFCLFFIPFHFPIKSKIIFKKLKI